MATTTVGTLGSTGVRRGKDPAPQLRAAGKGGIVEVGIFSDVERPVTPDNVKPFRKSAATTVGRAIKHHGSRNDEPLDENRRFGQKGNYTFTAEECLRPAVVDKMGALAAEHAEKRYQSSKREPLGRSPDSAIPVPEILNRNGFGMPTKNSENAKNIIYTCGDAEAPEQYPAGSQRNRKYDWAKAGIDPTKHRFGGQTAGSNDSTKDLFAPQQSKTALLPKITKDYQNLTACPLGRSRALGTGVAAIDPSTPAGATVPKANPNGGVDVRALLSNHGTADDDAYERTVGKPMCHSVTGRKLREQDKANSTASAGTGAGINDRVFGVPTVRNDLPRPLFRKVTSGNNYGDDVGAGALIYPNRYIARGIDEKYFSVPLDLDTLKLVCDQCQFSVDDADIAGVFNANNVNGKMTIEAFKDACFDNNV